MGPSKHRCAEESAETGMADEEVVVPAGHIGFCV